MTKFSDLLGQTITKIDGAEKGSGEIEFHTATGKTYRMFHYQDCCESVSIEDVVGDISDCIGSEVLEAEEVDSDVPEGWEPPEYEESYTWTFYKLGTRKGFVTIRWYGSSNGYYSESVDFEEVT